MKKLLTLSLFMFIGVFALGNTNTELTTEKAGELLKK